MDNTILHNLLHAAKELRKMQRGYFKASKARKDGLAYQGKDILLEKSKKLEAGLTDMIVALRDHDDLQVKKVIKSAQSMLNAQREYFLNKNHALAWKWLRPAMEREADFDRLLKAIEISLNQPQLL